MMTEQKTEYNRQRVKDWRKENPDKVKQQNRRYYLKHREKRLESMKAHYRIMRDKARAFDEMTGGKAE